MAYPNPNRKVRPIFTHLEHRAVQQVLEQVRRLPARDRARDRRARVGQRGQQPQRHLDRDQLAAVLPVVLPRAPPARARARTAQPCWATMHHSRMLHRRELLIPVALRAIQYAAQQCLATFLARGCVNASAPLATNGCGQSRVSRVFARMHWQELARGAPAAAAASLRGWLTGPRAPRSPPARDRAALCMLAPGQGVGCTKCTTRQCLAQPATPGEHAQHAAATRVPHCCTRSPPLCRSWHKGEGSCLGQVRSVTWCQPTAAALCRSSWCRPALRATLGARRGGAARLQGARICGRGGVLVGRHDLLYLRAAPPAQAAADAPRTPAPWRSCMSAWSRPGRGPVCAGRPPQTELNQTAPV